MSAVYKVLIIDDHPLIIDAYKNALSYVSKKDSDYQFEVDTANTCDKAYKKIIEDSKENRIDLVFLDIKLPQSTDGEILSGEDLGIKIRALTKGVKIIVSTTFNDNYLIHNIFKTINPESFLIKNDLTPKKLVQTIKSVLNGDPYHSKSVIKLLQNHLQNDFVLDKNDRQLLYQLSIGTKMKDLPDILPLSIGGIERRKRQLKELFDIINKDDKVLIQVAKDKGFI